MIEQFKEILKTFKILKMINISSFKQHQCSFFFYLKTIKYKYTKLPTTTQTHHTFNGNARYLFFPINVLFAPRFISLVMLSPPTSFSFQFGRRYEKLSGVRVSNSLHNIHTKLSAYSFYRGTSWKISLSCNSITEQPLSKEQNVFGLHSTQKH